MMRNRFNRWMRALLVGGLVAVAACGPLPNPPKPDASFAGYSLQRADCVTFPGSYLEHNADVFALVGEVLADTLGTLANPDGELGDFSLKGSLGLDLIKGGVTIAGREIAFGGNPLRLVNLVGGLACRELVHATPTRALSVGAAAHVSTGGVALGGGAGLRDTVGVTP